MVEVPGLRLIFVFHEDDRAFQRGHEGIEVLADEIVVVAGEQLAVQPADGNKDAIDIG